MAAAEAMDATLSGATPCVRSTLAEQWLANPDHPTIGGYRDVRDPRERLSRVPEPSYSHPLSVLDNISVANWANVVCTKVLGFDSIAKVIEFVAGEWTSLAKTGTAIGHIADAAVVYFTRVANTLADWHDPLKSIARQYASMAHGVAATTEAIIGVIKGMLDIVILAGIAAAAGTVTAETGIGAVVGYAVAAAEIANILILWGEATKAMQTLYGAVQGAAGLIESGIAAIIPMPLPSAAGGSGYDHPLAAR